jgi:hypothetical protein
MKTLRSFMFYNLRYALYHAIAGDELNPLRRERSKDRLQHLQRFGLPDLESTHLVDVELGVSRKILLRPFQKTARGLDLLDRDKHLFFAPRPSVADNL